MRAAAWPEALCARLPDVATFWQALSAQRRRIGDAEGSVRAARSALCANGAFGVPGDAMLRALQAASPQPGDPLIEAAKPLQLRFGGSRENPDYRVLQACIDACLSRGESRDALRLLHNYAYAMQAEMMSFQQREGFTRAAWRERFAAFCAEHFGDDRRTMR